MIDTHLKQSTRTDFSHCFLDHSIDLAILRKRAYNFRWAEQDRGIIPLTAADPDFSLAPPIQSALHDYISTGSLAYGPSMGLPEFREAVSIDLRRGGVEASPDQVIATDGAASALFLTAKSLLNTGDEAIIFDPVDFLFERSILAAGGVPLRVRFSREAGIDLDHLAELASRPRVKCIALCAPHNPFGRLISHEEISIVAEVAHRFQISIISDEVWAKIFYERPQMHVGAHPVAAPMTYTVSGFSKCYGLAGLRIGYIHAPTEEAFRSLRLASHAGDTAFGASTLSQVAAVAGLTQSEEWLIAFRAHLSKARSLICSRLNQLDGMHCSLPEATYLASPQLIKPAWQPEMNSLKMSEEIKRLSKVAVVPGSPQFFGAGAEGLIRFSFATSLGILSQALDRIEAVWPIMRARWGS